MVASLPLAGEPGRITNIICIGVARGRLTNRRVVLKLALKASLLCFMAMMGTLRARVKTVHTEKAGRVIKIEFLFLM